MIASRRCAHASRVALLAVDDLSRKRRDRERKARPPAQPENSVFLVTHGVDEDYHIVAAFSTHARAQGFIRLWEQRLREAEIDFGGPAPRIEVFAVDAFDGSSGAFRVTVSDQEKRIAYDPTGDPKRPADTGDAVEIDGAPQSFTGYGATPGEALMRALALRMSKQTR